jgi:hypothetical protein
MGGLAVKEIIGVEGKRFDKELRDKFQRFIAEALRTSGIYLFYFVTEHRGKDSFGDIDILVDSEYPFEEFKDNLHYKFNSNSFEYQGEFKNDKVTSVAISGYQIDFISTPREDLRPSFTYYANNDLGNLLGRIAHGMGLLYGHQGLKLKVRDKDDHVIDDILLTTNEYEIMQFIGFSQGDTILFQHYTQVGFPDITSIYEFVTRSNMFDGSKYELDQLNQINRIRNKKRPTYMGFIQYLAENPDKKNKRPLHPLHKEYYQVKALEYFGKESDYFKVKLKLHKKEWIAMKFNGELVRGWYGLEGKELGEFIKDFYSKYDRDTIADMSNLEIKKEADKLWENHSKTI